MFFICWAPFHAQRLLYVYALEADYYPDLNEWLYILGGFLYYLSTTVNPILYNLMSLKYRKAFKQTVCCKKQQRRVNRRSTLPDDGERSCCRCSAFDRRPHTLSFRCSFRSTIDHAKEMLKVSGNCREIGHSTDAHRHQDASSACDENSNAKLLPDRHLKINQQISNESTTTSGNNKITESLSTASSLL